MGTVVIVVAVDIPADRSPDILITDVYSSFYAFISLSSIQQSDFVIICATLSYQWKLKVTTQWYY